MKSIYIGVCKTREDERFKKSFRDFTDSICSKYSVCQTVVKDTFLADAQNYIAKCFIQSDYDYLLLMDDDHWGHTPEMLECLINADAYMATIKSYSRHYPYFSCLMNRRPEDDLFVGIEVGEGYIPCDMTGFPMTLIKRELFDKLEYPYFEAEQEGGRNWVTDTVFCRRLVNMGIKPVGCFQYCLPHADITEDNVIRKRREEGVRGDNFYWQMIFDKYVTPKLRAINPERVKGEQLCTAHQ